MDNNNNFVEWTENLTPEIIEFYDMLYNNYKKIEPGNPMDRPDFNGCIYMVSFYHWYIKEIEAGTFEESDKLPLLEAKRKFLKHSKRVHLPEILQ